MYYYYLRIFNILNLFLNLLYNLQEVEDAEKCLQAGTELTLLGNILDCHKALNRTEITNKTKKEEVKKDSRNLYLVKEGGKLVIINVLFNTY